MAAGVPVLLVLCACIVVGCAGPVTGASHVQRDRIIETPPPESELRLEPPGLAHLLRGMYFLQSGRAAAAVPHFRLALVYDAESAYIHEQLSSAWALAGQAEQSQAILRAGLDRAPNDVGLRRLAGQRARDSFDFVGAVEHLERAFAHEMMLVESAAMLVDSLLWLGRVDVARMRAAEALAQFPRDADLALDLAGAFEDHGMLDDAYEAYQACGVRQPSSLKAIFGQLRVLELKGRYALAADGLIPAFRFYPDHPSLFVRLSGLLLRAGRPDAEAYRAEAMRQTQDDPEGRVVIAGADFVAGDDERGLDLLRQTAKEFPGNLAVRLYFADRLERAGMPERCMQVLKGAERIDGGATAVHRARARCASASGRFGAALEALASWHRLEGKTDDVFLEGARIVCRAPSQHRASALLDELSRRLAAPITPRGAAIAEAVVADGFGQGERALSLVRSVAAHTPKDVDLQIRLAGLEAKYGQLDSALSRYTALVREDGRDVDRLNSLGYTLADSGRSLPRAEVWLRRAYRLAEEDSSVVDSLGWLLHRRGEHQPALELLRRASRMVPGDPEVLYHFATVLEKVGDFARAREVFERALGCRPSKSLRVVIERRLAEMHPGV